ncbi:MAG: hypothetical protein IKD85_06090 [Firmicutes bacterium]|nr:hypothetical protein [Bacillota bacterium]
MAKKYCAPVLLGTPDNPNPSFAGNWQDIREEKEDLANSFVYGDDNYEEEYVVPDIFEVIGPAASSDAAEDAE